MKRLIIIVAVCSTLIAQAQKIWIRPAVGTGATSAEIEIVTELVFRTAEAEGEVVVARGEANFELEPKLLRLGNAILVDVNKWQNGKMVFSSRLKAKHVEELDKVTARATLAAIQEQTPEAHVGNVTDEEASQGVQRRPTRPGSLLAFGPAWLGNLKSTGLGYSFGAAHGWDLNSARLKVFTDFAIQGAAFYLNTAIGVEVFFTDKDITPYLGGDFGFAVAKMDGGSFSAGTVVGGFALGIGAGVAFFRTHSVNLEVGARAGILLNDNGVGKPEVLMLRVGVFF